MSQVPPSADLPLSTTDGTELRSDLFDGENNPVSWRRASELLEIWMELGSNQSPLIEEWGGTSTLPLTSAHDRMQLRQLDQAYSKFRRKHLEAHTSIITLTATPIVEGGWVAGVDHLNGLLESWESVRQRTYDVFGGAETEYVRLLEPTSRGFPHIHLVVLSDEGRDEDDLSRIVDAHTENSPLASDSNHIADRCIRFERSLDISEVVSDNLDAFADNRDDSWRTNGFETLLWATNTDRIVLSDGAEDLGSEVDVEYEPDLTTV